MIPCAACGKQLYPLERMTLNNKVFHKQGCARCSTCNTNLTVNNFALSGDKLFCKTHYLSNFSRSGGRYSFSLEDQEEIPSASKTSTSNKARNQTPQSKMTTTTTTTTSSQRTMSMTATTTPIKQQQTAAFSTTTSASKLTSFLSNTESGSSASSSSRGLQQPTRTPMKCSPEIEKQYIHVATSTPSRATTSDQNAAPSGNKLTAFLSKVEGGPSPAVPLSQTKSYEQQPRKPVQEQKQQVEERMARPVSLKERIALYSMEVSKTAEPAVKPTKPSDLPPLPKKEITENRRGSNQSVSIAQTPTVQSRRNSSNLVPPAHVSSSKLTAFLQSAEPQQQTFATSSRSLSTASSSTTTSSVSVATQTSETNESTRPRPLSIHERIAAYSMEASKSDADRKPPPLPPAKPSYERVQACSPKKSTGAGHANAFSTKNNEPASPKGTEAKHISLKERIASYQARASGNNSSKSKSFGRKSNGGDTSTPSPTKKTGFRSRFPSFLKNPVYASPSNKSVELAKVLRKICDDGANQVSRAAIKNSDAVSDIKSIAVDLLGTFESILDRLDAYDQQRKSTNIG